MAGHPSNAECLVNFDQPSKPISLHTNDVPMPSEDKAQDKSVTIATIHW